MAQQFNCDILVKMVRLLVKSGKYRLTHHAVDRMEERNISEDKIENCIISGDVLEVQDHGRDIKLKVKSKSEDVFVIVTVQCDYSKNICAIIITCAHTIEQLNTDWDDIC